VVVSVVHLVLKTVTKALARAGCKSLQDAAAVQVMKDLGGYREIIENCIQCKNINSNLGTRRARLASSL
jgi:hypothetical protein